MLKHGLVGLGALPLICLVIACCVLLFLDRDRLQSEAFVLRQKELAILERKSNGSTSLEADDFIDLSPSGKGMDEGEGGQ